MHRLFATIVTVAVGVLAGIATSPEPVADDASRAAAHAIIDKAQKQAQGIAPPEWQSLCDDRDDVYCPGSGVAGYRYVDCLDNTQWIGCNGHMMAMECTGVGWDSGCADPNLPGGDGSCASEVVCPAALGYCEGSDLWIRFRYKLSGDGCLAYQYKWLKYTGEMSTCKQPSDLLGYDCTLATPVFTASGCTHVCWHPWMSCEGYSPNPPGCIGGGI